MLDFCAVHLTVKLNFQNHGWIWTWNQIWKKTREQNWNLKEKKWKKLTCSRYMGRNHTWRPKYFPLRSSCTNAYGVTASAMWARSARDRNVRVIWSWDWCVGHLRQLHLLNRIARQSRLRPPLRADSPSGTLPPRISPTEKKPKPLWPPWPNDSWRMGPTTNPFPHVHQLRPPCRGTRPARFLRHEFAGVDWLGLPPGLSISSSRRCSLPSPFSITNFLSPPDTAAMRRSPPPWTRTFSDALEFARVRIYSLGFVGRVWGRNWANVPRGSSEFLAVEALPPCAAGRTELRSISGKTPPAYSPSISYRVDRLRLGDWCSSARILYLAGGSRRAGYGRRRAQPAG
jgi:hypothetical protein